MWLSEYTELLLAARPQSLNVGIAIWLSLFHCRLWRATTLLRDNITSSCISMQCWVTQRKNPLVHVGGGHAAGQMGGRLCWDARDKKQNKTKHQVCFRYISQRCEKHRLIRACAGAGCGIWLTYKHRLMLVGLGGVLHEKMHGTDSNKVTMFVGGTKLNVSVQQIDHSASGEGYVLKVYAGRNNADIYHCTCSSLKWKFRVRRNRKHDEGKSAGEMEHIVLCTGTATEPNLGCTPPSTSHRDVTNRRIYESALKIKPSSTKLGKY